MHYMNERSVWMHREINRRWAKAHIASGVCGIICVGLMLVFQQWIILGILIIPAVLAFVCGYQTVPQRLQREYDGKHHEEPEYHAYLRMVERSKP